MVYCYTDTSNLITTRAFLNDTSKDLKEVLDLNNNEDNINRILHILDELHTDVTFFFYEGHLTSNSKYFGTLVLFENFLSSFATNPQHTKEWIANHYGLFQNSIKIGISLLQLMTYDIDKEILTREPQYIKTRNLSRTLPYLIKGSIFSPSKSNITRIRTSLREVIDLCSTHLNKPPIVPGLDVFFVTQREIEKRSLYINISSKLFALNLSCYPELMPYWYDINCMAVFLQLYSTHAFQGIYVGPLMSPLDRHNERCTVALIVPIIKLILSDLQDKYPGIDSNSNRLGYLSLSVLISVGVIIVCGGVGALPTPIHSYAHIYIPLQYIINLYNCIIVNIV